MYTTRELGELRLDFFSPSGSQLALSDFCAPATTIELDVISGLELNETLGLFKLTYPGYSIEAWLRDGMVGVRRNGIWKESRPSRDTGAGLAVIQWNTCAISCALVPRGSSDERIRQELQFVETPFTLPPTGIVDSLRKHHLVQCKPYPDAGALLSSVLDCLRLCEGNIRRLGCERYMWKAGGLGPLDELDLSRFVASYLTTHGQSRGFEVVCEAIAGTGNMDSFVVAPIAGGGFGRVVIEGKKADSAKVAHGLAVQLPEYMARVGTHFGIFLTYWLRSVNYPYPLYPTYAAFEVEQLLPIQRPSTVRTIAIDLSHGPTPSKM